MEVLHTAPTFLALILIAYGVFLTGFTGGAVAGVGILFYVLSRAIRESPSNIWEGVAGVSGMAWTSMAGRIPYILCNSTILVVRFIHVFMRNTGQSSI